MAVETPARSGQRRVNRDCPPTLADQNCKMSNNESAYVRRLKSASVISESPCEAGEEGECGICFLINLKVKKAKSGTYAGEM